MGIEKNENENLIKKKKLGVALFGLGRAGRIHFNNILRSRKLHLISLVEERMEMAQDAVDEWFDETMHKTTPKLFHPSELQIVLENKEIDFVIVASPTKTHENIVIASLKAGKSVFCEKPVAETREATDLCYDMAEHMGKQLFCAFNRRFDPTVRSLKERVRLGEIGKIHLMKTCSRDSPLPPIEFLRISGGMFHDCAVHDIDIVCWVLNERPCSVYSTAYCHNEEIKSLGDFDTIIIVLNFPSGALANIDLSRGSTYGYDQRIEVFGSDGMLSMANVHDTQVVSACKSGVNSSTFKHSFPERYEEAYRNELDHFCSVIQGKEVRLVVTKESTSLATRIASACEKSARTKTLIHLDWED